MAAAAPTLRRVVAQVDVRPGRWMKVSLGWAGEGQLARLETITTVLDEGCDATEIRAPEQLAELSPAFEAAIAALAIAMRALGAAVSHDKDKQVGAHRVV